MSEEEVKFDIRLIAQRAFSGEGEQLLLWIIDRCKFMTPCENEKDVGKNEFCKELLRMMYSLEDGTADPYFFNKIKKVMLNEKEKEL